MLPSPKNFSHPRKESKMQNNSSTTHGHDAKWSESFSQFVNLSISNFQLCGISSNGLLDPWSSGGVMKSISDSVVSVIIPEGAHHLDLRGANDRDPPSVKKMRMVEKKYIRYFAKMSKSVLHYS